MSRQQYNANDLHIAIMANSFALTSLYVDAGANLDDTPELPELRALVGSNGLLNITSYRIATYGENDYQLTALHAAVINCYYNWDNNTAALSIIQALLAAGADTKIKCSSVVLYNLQTFGWLKVDELTPVGLAAVLKQNSGPKLSLADLRCSVLDEAISLLVKAEKTQCSCQRLDTTDFIKLPTKAELVWSKMLLCKDFADVIFKCSDDVELYAHKAVLAASSTYFHNYFRGPWSQLHPNGYWHTANSSIVMEAVLTYIYTGTVCCNVLKDQSSDLLFLAAEYDLPGLIDVAENYNIQNIDFHSVKELIQVAHLHGLRKLKRVCFDFVRDNSVQLMLDSDFMSLTVDQSDVWAELAVAVAPNSTNQSPRKRARKEEVNSLIIE